MRVYIVVTNIWRFFGKHFAEVSPTEFHSAVFGLPDIRTPWSNKKQDTKLLSISSPNIDRFSKFFHYYTQQEICIKTSLQILPHLNSVAKLPCEILVSENVACPICWGTVFYGVERQIWRYPHFLANFFAEISPNEVHGAVFGSPGRYMLSGDTIRIKVAVYNCL